MSHWTNRLNLMTLLPQTTKNWMRIFSRLSFKKPVKDLLIQISLVDSDGLIDSKQFVTFLSSFKALFISKSKLLFKLSSTFR